MRPRFAGDVGAAWCAPVVAGSAAAWVRCADKMGIFGSGELGRDEVADRLKCRRTHVEGVALRFDDELIPPELGELLGAARDERLGRQNARDLAVECVSLRPLLDGRSACPFAVELFLALLALDSQGVLDLALSERAA